MIIVKPYTQEKIKFAIEIWNEVVRGGIAFPQENELDEVEGDKFFKSQSFTGLAEDTESGEKIVKHSIEKARELGFKFLQEICRAC